MKVTNGLAAKILGEIIAEGMNMSQINLEDRVKSEAIGVLGDIKSAMSDTCDEAEKLCKIKEIMSKYNID